MSSGVAGQDCSVQNIKRTPDFKCRHTVVDRDVKVVPVGARVRIGVHLEGTTARRDDVERQAGSQIVQPLLRVWMKRENSSPCDEIRSLE